MARYWRLAIAPTWHWPKFSAEVKLPKITAIRLELLNDPDLAAWRAGPVDLWHAAR